MAGKNDNDGLGKYTAEPGEHGKIQLDSIIQSKDV